MLFLLLIAGASALAIGSYLVLERLGRRGLAPSAARALAWSVVGLLLVNPGCPGSASRERTLVLLDGSLSMATVGAQWEAARREAAGMGEVRLFGDPGWTLDSLPLAGESRLAPALMAAAATGRPVALVTDGEITDRPDVPGDLLRQATIRLFPRRLGPALALRRVELPERVAPADTVPVDVEVAATSLPEDTGPLRLAIRDGERVLSRGEVRLDGGTSARAVLILPPRSLTPGEHALTIEVVDSLDAERRDDRRVRILTVTPTPGLVVAASQPDWDSRFLFQTLGEVTELPVEGYVQLERGQWRRMTDLTPVPAAAVERALTRANVAIRYGPASPGDTRPRGVWEWRPPNAELPGQDGDWYLAPGAGPLGAALAGAPIDSFPPAVGLAEGGLPEDAWVGLTAQLGRRGGSRPAMAGWERGGRRTVVTLGRGLWRWAFRGGSSEQAYRTLIASTVDWLLGAGPDDEGQVRPLRRVVPAGRPLSFVWIGAGAPQALEIRLNRPGRSEAERGVRSVVDTLRFDPSGIAEVRVEPGIYTYSIDGTAEGLVAVETYSEEWFPRPVQLEEAVRQAANPPSRRRPRDEPWLFLLPIAGFGLEWGFRRRMGLR